MPGAPEATASPRGVNSAAERLTSGTSTSIPMERHSARYTAVLSLLSFTEVSRAAMYSTG